MQLCAAMNEYLLDIMAVNGGITIINDNSQRTSMQINFPIGIQVAMLLSRRFWNSDCDCFYCTENNENIGKLLRYSLMWLNNSHKLLNEVALSS